MAVGPDAAVLRASELPIGVCAACRKRRAARFRTRRTSTIAAHRRHHDLGPVPRHSFGRLAGGAGRRALGWRWTYVISAPSLVAASARAVLFGCRVAPRSRASTYRESADVAGQSFVHGAAASATLERPVPSRTLGCYGGFWATIASMLVARCRLGPAAHRVDRDSRSRRRNPRRAAGGARHRSLRAATGRRRRHHAVVAFTFVVLVFAPARSSSS